MSRKRAKVCAAILVTLLLAVVPLSAEATIFFMSPTGRDEHSCVQAQDIATPKATFASVVPCMAGGDTLLLREGRYEQILESVPSGSLGNPTVISSYHGELVTLRPTGAEASVLLTNATYITLRKLSIDGGGVTTHGVVASGGHDITLEGLTIWHVLGSAILMSGTSVTNIHEATIFGQLGPGISLAAGTQDAEVRNSVIDGFGGACLASQGSEEKLNTSTIFRANKCLHGQGPAVVLRWSVSDKLINNVLAQSGGGVRIEQGVSDIAVLHNTIADNTTGAGYGVSVDPSAANIHLVNNIIYNNTEGIVDPGNVASRQTNFEENPHFVKAKRGNYRLQINSKAQGTGMNRFAEVSTDIRGERREPPKDVLAHIRVPRLVNEKPETMPATPGAFEVFTLPPARQFAATGCTHYALPDAHGNGSFGSPFSIGDFWAVAYPGAKLCLLDGWYRGGANGLYVPAGTQGSPGNPISIVSYNDGGAFIDTEYEIYSPFGIWKSNPVIVAHDNIAYVTIEGINAAHGWYGVFGTDSEIQGDPGVAGASYITFRRVVGWDSVGPDCCTNSGVAGNGFGVENTFEDIAGFGCGRKMWTDYRGEQGHTAQAFYIKYKYNNFPATCHGGYGPGEGGAPFSYMYDSHSNQYYNTVVSQDSSFGGNTDENRSGIWDHDYFHDWTTLPNENADFTQNQNMVYQVDPQTPSPSTRWNMNNMIGPSPNSSHYSHTDARNRISIRRNSSTFPETDWAEWIYCGQVPCNQDGNFQAYFTSSTGPNLNTATNETDVGNLPLSSFQNGLLQLDANSQPTNGAWMKYRFTTDGTRTGDALWPWAMDQRISDAIGSSQYASAGVDGVGGLSVTDTVMALTGSTIEGGPPGWTPIVDTFYISATGTQHDCALARDPGTPFSVVTQPNLTEALACGLGKSTYVFFTGDYPPLQTSTSPIPAGDATTKTMLRAYNSALETVVTFPYIWMDRGTADAYLHFKDLRLDPNYTPPGVTGIASNPSGGASNITFEGGFIRRTGREAVEMIDTPNFILRDTAVAQNGGLVGALVALTGATNALIENVQIFSGTGDGIALVGSSAIVSRNRVYENTGAGIRASGAGAVTIRNNIIDQNGGGGIIVAASKTGTQIFNNTLWNNTNVGIDNTTASGTQITNTIVTASATLINGTPGQTTNVLGDPDFVDPQPPATFHVEGANAVGQGTTIASVTVDYAGNARTVPYTIGAYEDEVVSVPPPVESYAPRSTLFFLTQ
jgi:parallel beta-helix repeat protein